MDLQVGLAIRECLEALGGLIPSLSDLAVLVHTPNPESPGLLAILQASAAARGCA